MNTLSPGKPWVTKLSSAGLIYLHFGHRVISQVLKTKEDDDVTHNIYDKIYENFIQEIDAIDNGISQSDEEPRYKNCLLFVYDWPVKGFTTNIYWENQRKGQRYLGVGPLWPGRDHGFAFSSLHLLGIIQSKNAL